MLKYHPGNWRSSKNNSLAQSLCRAGLEFLKIDNYSSGFKPAPSSILCQIFYFGITSTTIRLFPQTGIPLVTIRYFFRSRATLTLGRGFKPCTNNSITKISPDGQRWLARTVSEVDGGGGVFVRSVRVRPEQHDGYRLCAHGCRDLHSETSANGPLWPNFFVGLIFKSSKYARYSCG